MKVTGSTSSSTCGNVNDVVGGRKTLESIVSNETSSGTAVLVNIDTDDAVTFDDESLPFESSEESDDETEEEESEEEEWSSDEEEYDAGKFYVVNSHWPSKLMFLMLKFQRFPGATR